MIAIITMHINLTDLCSIYNWGNEDEHRAIAEDDVERMQVDRRLSDCYCSAVHIRKWILHSLLKLT